MSNKTLSIYLSENFKFIDASLPFIYSLAKEHNGIFSASAIRSNEYTTHKYFAPYLTLDITENYFYIFLNWSGELTLSYSGKTAPKKEVLEIADILLKQHYYSALAPKDKAVFDKIYAALNEENIKLFPDAKTPAAAKKQLKAIQKMIDEKKIAEIRFSEDGGFELLPQEELTEAELEEIANIEGSIRYDGKNNDTIEIVYDGKNKAYIKPEESENE